MADLTFYKTNNPNAIPIANDQIIFDTSGDGFIYIDEDGVRKELGGVRDGFEITLGEYSPIVTIEDVTENDSTSEGIAKVESKANNALTTSADLQNNLLIYPFYSHTTTNNGITFTDNGDGTITLNGTATANASCILMREVALTTLGLDTSSKLYVRLFGGNSNIYLKTDNVNVSSTVINSSTGSSIAHTMTSLTVYLTSTLIVKSGQTLTNYVVSPMYIKGIVAPTAFKSYQSTVAYLKQRLANCQPNLIEYPFYSNGTLTTSGITYRDTGNGQLTIGGTSTASSTYTLMYRSDVANIGAIGDVLTLSGGKVNITLQLQFLNSSYSVLDTITTNSSVTTIIPQNAKYVNIVVAIANGRTISSTVISPSLIVGDVAPSIYRPYSADHNIVVTEARYNAMSEHANIIYNIVNS